jgi:phosphoglycolate phosphatase-like HAD superfamily hydrolase
VKLVLFDIDGTLLLTHGAARRALHAALGAVFGGIGTTDLPFDGKTDPQIVRELMRMDGHDEARIDADLPRAIERYLEELTRELAEPTNTSRLMPGVSDLLETLEARADVVLGLLTGNVEPGARAKLTRVGLSPERFRVGAFGSDHGERPALPAIAQRRAREIVGREFAGADVVIIGDTPADVMCGRGIGARAIAVATGRFTRDELAGYGPAAIFADLTDTAAVIAAIVS